MENERVDFVTGPSVKRCQYMNMLTSYMELNETEKYAVGYRYEELIYECEYRGVDCHKIR